MGARLDSNVCRRAAILAVAALVAMLALGGLGADAEAKKKKKKAKNPAVTISAPTPLNPGALASGTATCPGKTHVTGGGFAVAPSFTPPGAGLRSLNSTSRPSGPTSWIAGGGAYASPQVAGQLTTFARCERNTAGRIDISTSGSVTINPATGQNMVFNCPTSSHVISGGYSASSLGDFAPGLNSHRVVVVQNRRTGVGQWTVSAFNNPNSPGAETLTGYATCEADAKGSAVTEAASPATPVVDDGRTAADATCAGKTHSVSGGFLVSHTFPGTVPLVSVDENQPVGKGGWHLGLSEYPQVFLPAGTTLQAFAYCKKG